MTASTEGAKFVIVLVALLIEFNYDANLSLFPSFTKDLWGLKNFGMNYGIIFTAWSVGGFALSRLSQMLYQASKDAAGKGNYQSSFITAGILLIVGAALTLLIRPQVKDTPPPLSRRRR